jgi:predicted DNA-binding protein
MSPSIQISVKVSVEDYQRLKKICDERSQKLSGVIRGLIADYVDNYNFIKKGVLKKQKKSL